MQFEEQEMRYVSLIAKTRKLERSNATLKAKVKDQKRKDAPAPAVAQVMTSSPCAIFCT